MGKKKSQSKQAASVTSAPDPHQDLASRIGALNVHDPDRASQIITAVPIPAKTSVVAAWMNYFGRGELADWQRLCHDVGLPGNLSSKTKCREALKGVWVNICDFLDAPHKPDDVFLFPNKQALAEYTCATRRIFPKRKIQKGSPLRQLLSQIF